LFHHALKSNVSIIVCYADILGLFGSGTAAAILVPEFSGHAFAGWPPFLASTSPFLVIFRLPLHVFEGGYNPADSGVHFSLYVICAVIINVLAALASLANLSARGRLLQTSQ
jgi:hypothetical protein